MRRSFRVKVRFKNKTYEVIWRNGDVHPKSERDAPFVAMLHDAAKLAEGRYVGPHTMGCKTVRDHLKDPLSALALIMELADAVIETSGKVPTAPRVPKGAWA